MGASASETGSTPLPRWTELARYRPYPEAVNKNQYYIKLSFKL
jgi:hypothetical protein